LALDQDANLIVMELKRDKTPRDIIAQVLDYGSWVRELKADRLGQIMLMQNKMVRHTANKLRLSTKK